MRTTASENQRENPKKRIWYYLKKHEHDYRLKAITGKTIYKDFYNKRQ
jgi:hypothetical protein